MNLPNEDFEALQQGIDQTISEGTKIRKRLAQHSNQGPYNAEWEVEEVRIINPDFSLTHMQQAFPFKDPADREHFMQGLRMAGFSK